jgi:aspartyl-tRNA synthetase
VLRSRVIASIRRRMIERGFTEFQTPILTSSSPEGARDYPGAEPRAPGQVLRAAAGAAAVQAAADDRGLRPLLPDRAVLPRRGRPRRPLAGEFYQLDLEMSFVTQEDVFAALEPVLHGVFEEFADRRTVSPPPFPRIPYDEALARYGTDKPDLRNPLVIHDVGEVFRGSASARSPRRSRPARWCARSWPRRPLRSRAASSTS